LASTVRITGVAGFAGPQLVDEPRGVRGGIRVLVRLGRVSAR
jgi:hypothetical protein